MREVRINFGLNDRWVQNLVSTNCWAIAETKLWTRGRWVQTKNWLQFSLVSGLSPYFGLSLGLGERLMQKVKSPVLKQQEWETEQFPACQHVLESSCIQYQLVSRT